MSEKCFAMKNHRCVALVDGSKCAGCAFYKTAAQQKADQEHAWERMRNLSIETQQIYSNLYYGDRMPWYGEEA